MQITFFSFVSAVAWHSILVIMIYFMRKINGLNMRFGIFVMIALYLGGIVRIVVPLEFSYTMVISSNEIYPAVYRILYKECFAGTIFEGQVVSYLILIWLVVTCILLVKYIIHYIAVSRKIMEFTRPCDVHVAKVMEYVKKQANEQLTVDVLICSDTYIPFGLGVFKRKILLPDNNYNDSDLYFILLHEYTHFVNKDITVKFLIAIFCIVFWWNPLVYLLKKDLEQTLEIKCDLTIVKQCSTKEKAEYLQAILNALKDISKQRRMPTMYTALLQNGREMEIKERFTKVMNCRANVKGGFFDTTFLLVFIFLVTVSYAFILQPSFEAPDSTNGVSIMEFDSVDSYLKKIKDGQYELYIENESQGMISEDAADMFKEDGFPIVE